MLDQCLARELMKIASWRICWNQPGSELVKWILWANMKMVGWFGLRFLVGFVCWCWLGS